MIDALPAYTHAALKSELLTAGASGTIYSLVMPETEAAMARVVDGCDRATLLHDPAALHAAGVRIGSTSIANRGRSGRTRCTKRISTAGCAGRRRW